jgi:uncharacterized protein YrrD
MSIKASSLHNLQIVTLTDGKNVDKVKDVIYDGQSNKVKALLIDEKGWFKGAKILLLSDVTSIGTDAVTIENHDCFISSDDQTDDNISVIVNDNNFLSKNRVMTESGVDLGRVTDIYFEFPSGTVTAIEVSKGFMQNILSGKKSINVSDIITVGKDNLVVSDVTEEDFDSQQQGLQKVANEAKTTTASIAAATVSKTQEMVEIAKSKIDEVVKSKPVQDGIVKTQEIANNAKDKVMDTFKDAKDEIQSGRAEEKIKNTFNDTKQKTVELGENVQDKVSHLNSDTKDDIKSSQTELNTSEDIELNKENHEKVTNNEQYFGDELSEDHNLLLNNAIGKTVQTEIVNDENYIVAEVGDVVTEELILEATDHNVLDKLLVSIK